MTARVSCRIPFLLPLRLRMLSCLRPPLMSCRQGPQFDECTTRCHSPCRNGCALPLLSHCHCDLCSRLCRWQLSECTCARIHIRARTLLGCPNLLRCAGVLELTFTSSLAPSSHVKGCCGCARRCCCCNSEWRIAGAKWKGCIPHSTTTRG